MPELTPDGQRIVNDLAQRYGFSPDAVTHLMIAVVNGNGTLAQFSHPEFGGSGQWMIGGMTMVGDMFNSALKGRVEALCTEISTILGNQPGLLRTGSFQSQSQSSGPHPSVAGALLGPSTLFVPDPKSQWYPTELGVPDATGSQNNVRYAYFAKARRLAVETGGDVSVYDTQDHNIGGFSQQQGSKGSNIFTSQFGNVALDSLRVVSRNGKPVAATPSTSATGPLSPGGAPATSATKAAGDDIFNALERLGDLKAKGILSDEEFTAKKTELLGRL
jgi:hypothetical protein